ncbi:methylated-DNA--[protein]-cysteine S-methyltransferase [Brevibacillus borstelensis]|uniref:methylated-DNA--[protein]-cysteine S-methyltransferase n=1 Tax=Brevibacillus borstelensis TaxID=45462 RepID=UPI0030C2B98F
MKGNTSPTIYWTMLDHENWRIYLAATAKGLCYVGTPNKPWEELRDWTEKRFPASSLVQGDEKVQPYAIELVEYLQGTRKRFSIPFDLYGTPFQLAVWNVLCQIPYGQTSTYSAIAQQIEKPAAVRAVGAAIGANPVLITVPCHRVIGKNGSLTGYRGGFDVKTKLLQLENAEGSAANA